LHAITETPTERHWAHPEAVVAHCVAAQKIAFSELVVGGSVEVRVRDRVEEHLAANSGAPRSFAIKINAEVMFPPTESPAIAMRDWFSPLLSPSVQTH